MVGGEATSRKLELGREMLGSRAAVAQGWKLGWVFGPLDEQGFGGGFALVPSSV